MNVLNVFQVLLLVLPFLLLLLLLPKILLLFLLRHRYGRTYQVYYSHR